ncbi:MAG: hypothetical protein OXC10_21540 [Rhodospirillaceae bacterium]|nr:hypothetical protein [Rhodospirillaceae bacterium]
MPKSSIEELVEAALDRLPPQHTEEVVHDVFETIENDPALLREYKSLCDQYKTSADATVGISPRAGRAHGPGSRSPGSPGRDSRRWSAP